MKAKVIKIGNSRGVRIPKVLLDEVGLGEDVILEASKGGIVIRPSYKVRAGWTEAFREMAEYGDDKLLDSDKPRSSWDQKDWEWK